MDTKAFPADQPFRTKSLLLPKGTYTLALNGSEELRVYPNPSNGAITIEGEKENRDIEIFTLQGRMIKTLKGNEKKLHIELPLGEYLIRKGSYAQLVIIQ